MDKELIAQMQGQFDALAHTSEGGEVEFWCARDLQEPLDYVRWENFLKVIEKAALSCQNAGYDPEDHFRGITKMVSLGSGAQRQVDDFLLTRYACYLIAQNGDPRKDAIAFAQTYFALQTRKQELIEQQLLLQGRLEARQRLRESERALSENIYERGVDNRGFGRIRSKGDAALFGGNNTQSMKNRFAVPTSRPLADFLPTLTIAAKNLATEMTNHNVKEDDLQGECQITHEHVQNNASLREMLGQRGIQPEDLPPEEDIKKLERRVKSHEKRLGKEVPKLPNGEITEEDSA